MVVAVVTSLSYSDYVRLEGSGDGWVHPLELGWVMRCRFLQGGSWAVQSPVCCTMSQGCVWSEAGSSLTMLSCRTEAGGAHWSAFLGIGWPSLSCSLQLRSLAGARGKGMKSVGGACTEGEAVMPMCTDLG